MKLFDLNGFALAGILSYFDSCFLHMVSLFLKKNINTLEAFVLADIYVCDISNLFKAEENFCIKDNFVTYTNNDIKIIINSKFNSVMIDANLSFLDKENIEYILRLARYKTA